MAPVGTCGAPFAADIRNAHDGYSKIIRDAHISAE
jgi:hypothetical protein